MSLLQQNMYGSEFNHKSKLFGLHCGQMRCEGKLVHNGGWYNRNGEKLGWGDLSTDDFLRIRRDLPETELFVVLHEQESFWKFVTQVGWIGSMCSTKPTVDAPGIDYVAEHCAFIVSRVQLYHVEDDERFDSGYWDYYGLKFRRISHEQAKNLLLYGTLIDPPKPGESWVQKEGVGPALLINAVGSDSVVVSLEGKLRRESFEWVIKHYLRRDAR